MTDTKKDTELAWTGERYVPQVRGTIALEHLHRYAFASEHVEGKVVLDIASGEGYGSEMLSRTAKHVYGVDIDEASVRHAQQKYKLDNLEYAQGSCTEIPLPNASVDVVVSFETIEHITDHEKMMQEVKRVLRPRGVLIISSPERLEYSEVPKHENPFHLKELSQNEFKELINNHFKYSSYLGQRVLHGSSLVGIEGDVTVARTYDFSSLPEKIQAEKGISKPVYIIAVCSDQILELVAGSLCEQKIWESEFCAEQFQKISSLSQERDNLVHDISEKEEVFLNLNQLIAFGDSQNQRLKEQLSEKEGVIGSLNERINSREEKIQGLQAQVSENESVIAEKERLITELENQLLEKKEAIKGLKFRLRTQRETISWKVTRPLRMESYNLRKFQGVLQRIKNPIKRIKSKLKKIKYSYREGQISPKNKSFSKDKTNHSEGIATDIRAIAIYLPQFHAIPENNDWWGKGFTEWTNVKRGRPQYKGHYQPHIPHPDIGYYDLNDASILEKQAELARAHGIEGFCFYYYWFQGKRLLEMPTDRMLASGKPEFPFCFCWANENWTRTWDGGENEILINQIYSEENNEKIIIDLIPAFLDARYIRIDGKPLFIVYRSEAIPDFSKVVKKWRKICKKHGVGEIYIAVKRSFASKNKIDLGVDAFIQFPPLLTQAVDLKSEKELQAHENFSGHIYDYNILPAFHAFPDDSNGKIFSAICPSWDNTSRRQERGTSWINSSPENYYRWLKTIIERTRKTFKLEERLVFINAWNEWAEGCHLEPDEKYGYAWLNATREALRLKSGDNSKELSRVLIIGHDAHLAGAQSVLLSLLREWSRKNVFEFKIVLREGGVLLSDYQEIADVMIHGELTSEKAKQKYYNELKNWSPELIFSSTITNGLLLRELRQNGLMQPIVTYTHELQKSIDRWAPGKIISETLRNTDFFLCGGDEVAENLINNHSVSRERCEVVKGFIDTWEKNDLPEQSKIEAYRKELDIHEDDIVVFGCGTTDWRKGSDLFIEIGRCCIEKNKNIKFFWIGGDADLNNKKISSLGLCRNIRFLPNVISSRKYYYVGAVFLLSSREDPFPLVALEAADAGLPIVCFEGAGGMPAFVAGDAGVVLPYENVSLAAEAVLELANNQDKRKTLGEYAREKVRDLHTSPIAAKKIACYIQDIVEASEATIKIKPLVSVVVPNYNHSKYLPERLKSIAKQTYKNIEIILLDDASTDESVDILEEFVGLNPKSRLIKNECNSGSTFKQWKKGISEARGKYVWIAESDDSAEPRFLEKLVNLLESDPEIIIATCQLRMMDPDGNVGGTPDEWLGELDGKRWHNAYVNDGLDEIWRFLSKKNTILNASGVVFKKTNVTESLIDDSMRLCADWLFWIRMLTHGKIAYTPEVLNYWRLQTSNARTKKSGVHEWEEGTIIMKELATILQVDQGEGRSLLQNFLNRCNKWIEQ